MKLKFSCNIFNIFLSKYRFKISPQKRQKNALKLNFLSMNVQKKKIIPLIATQLCLPYHKKI